MRRRAPRTLSTALEAVVEKAAPAGLLARAQAIWPQVAGPAVAAESWPESERHGVVTVACSSSVWAHELELLAPDLARRLRSALGEDGSLSLRFRAGPRGNS